MASLEGWGFTIKLYPLLLSKGRVHLLLRQGFSREIKKKLPALQSPNFMGLSPFLRFYYIRNKIPVFPCRVAGVVQW